MLAGKIYKLVDKRDATTFYVGSTANSLKDRLSQHKTFAKDIHKTTPVFVKIREIGADNVGIELVEDFPCLLKKDLLAREGEVIKEHLSLGVGIVNNNIAGRSKSQYYADNAERLREKQNAYYAANRDRILELNMYRVNFLRAQSKEYYRIHKARILQQQKQRRALKKQQKQE